MGADPDTSCPSPQSPPAPAASPPREPLRGEEEERGGVEPTDHPSPSRHALPAGADSSPAPPPPSPASAAPMPQHPKVSREEEAVEEHAAAEEVVEEEGAAVAGGEGEALRSFFEEFGDQADDCLIPSPRLKGIATPDRPAALKFLGDRYNNLMEKYKQQVDKYKQQVAKCAEECAPRFDGLKKYTVECAERLRLYNELIELRGNIRVFCRCRSLSADEISRGCSYVIEVDPSQETDLQYVPTEKERKSFKFDHVFGPVDDQEAVFAESLPVVRSVMDGFNVCIFAYGQTGTGKTFTMEGVPENRVLLTGLSKICSESPRREAHLLHTHFV